MFKILSARILLLIFFANFFYEENGLFIYKRIIYSILTYWAIFDLGRFTWNWIQERRMREMPSFYQTHLVTIIVFTLFNVFVDLRNPRLNLVTLINNPQAMLSVVPVFLFLIGRYAEDFTGVFKVLRLACIFFLMTWVITLPGRLPFYPGYIASHAILPFFLISFVDKKKMAFAITLLAAAAVFSMFSNYRIVLLQLLFFFGLFFSLGAVKNNNYLKFLIILLACGLVFIALNNLQDVLAMFKGILGKKDFDGDDTRSFLYQELFADFSTTELFFGRGFLGTYFSDYFLMLMENLDDTGDFYQRFGIEVGVLQLILKGGFVYYFLYTFPLWFIAVRGIFWHSELTIAFYISIYILTELLLMFFENIPYFNFQFSLLFLFAGFAYRVIYFRKKSIVPDTLVSVE
ncbi:hypothetical protein [Dyadobacter luticola]|uniref:O-antigen ligase family protein n=1 Tax=Dyadobacter luticola TaxID=1979387 RepID=A0A5R9L2Q1_9BACT|nr:hypothetical protein [Dyadobacter luticola]TLV02836.1 hypothetical protein FEN17_04260 [Dyadobacter luticola]